MARQSISFTSPNDEWLKAQVESEEYSSKSEVVNDLIRKAREIEYTAQAGLSTGSFQSHLLRERLISSEQSGISNLSGAEILAKSKDQLRQSLHEGDQGGFADYSYDSIVAEPNEITDGK